MSARARVRRLVPPGNGEWIEIEIVMQSANGESLMVTASDGLSTGTGVALLEGRMALALLRDKSGGGFRDILSGSRWELERPK